MGLFDSIKNAVKGSVGNSVKGAVGNVVNSNVRSTINKSVTELTNKAKNGIAKSVTTKTKSFKFDVMPSTLEEFKTLPGTDLKDYFATAALTVVALCVCAENMDAGCEILDFLNGPNTFTPADRQFIETQFMDGRRYTPRSYFKGAKPENNYTPDQPYEIEIIEVAHSKDNIDDGYIRLFIMSGGADNERIITLRTKKSTGEWFVNDFRGLLTSIRLSNEQDAWA